MRDAETLVRCLLRGRPYFGEALVALQGPPERHRFFAPTVKWLCERVRRDLRMLEIGSWAGASTVSWIKAAGAAGRDASIDCVDPWEPYFDLATEGEGPYREMNDAATGDDVFRLFKHNVAAAGIESRVTVRRGRSRDVLPSLPERRYHLVYIDGSHRYDDVLLDIRGAQRVVVEGGVICGDDLEVQADAIDEATLAMAVASGRDYVAPAPGGPHFHPGVTRAVGEALGAVSAWEGYWAVAWKNGEACPLELDMTATAVPEHILEHMGRRGPGTTPAAPPTGREADIEPPASPPPG